MKRAVRRKWEEEWWLHVAEDAEASAMIRDMGGGVVKSCKRTATEDGRKSDGSVYTIAMPESEREAWKEHVA